MLDRILMNSMVYKSTKFGRSPSGFRSPSPSIFIKSQNNWYVFKVYSDGGYTGANVDRPALQELLTDIKQGGINLILAYKIDRLTRSPKDFYQLIEEFEKNGVDFISITERFDTSTPSGRLLRNIMLTFAQFERELTSERTKDKMLQRAQKGMWNGGIVPYGYKKENKKLFVDLKESEIIRFIFGTYVETSSIAKVYDELKNQGLKNRDSETFIKSHLEGILRNIIYTGQVKYSGKIYPGNHEPIISDGLFDLAQQTHKEKIRKLRLYKDFLLGGLVNCQECGSKMTSSFTNKRKREGLKRYYFYRCTSTLKKDWQACSTKHVSAYRLENFVLENLERISNDKAYLENLIFRLNNDSGSGYRDGFELTESCPPLSAEIVQERLKTLVKSLDNQRGIERNLTVKKFIKGINYSKDQIGINLYYPSDFCAPQNQIPLTGARSREFENEKGIPARETGNPQFDIEEMAPR